HRIGRQRVIQRREDQANRWRVGGGGSQTQCREQRGGAAEFHEIAAVQGHSRSPFERMRSTLRGRYEHVKRVVTVGSGSKQPGYAAGMWTCPMHPEIRKAGP